MGKSLKMFYYLFLTSYAEVDLVDRCLLRKALGTTLPPCGRKGKGQMWTEREISYDLNQWRLGRHP